MQDELFQRQWTQAHSRFSHDVDAGFRKLHRVLTALSVACAPGLQRKADATAMGVVIGFIAGAALGAAMLASVAATPSIQNSAAEAAPMRIAPARIVLA